MATTVKFTLDGKPRTIKVEDPAMPLIYALRDDLKMKAPHFGCGVAQCGACTVHLDGAPVRSCSLPLSAVGENQKIVTIEGLSPRGDHPLQKAWIALDVPQCGYCQSGMILAVSELLKSNPKPTDAQIDSAINNLCVCGTYQRVREAIHFIAGN